MLIFRSTMIARNIAQANAPSVSSAINEIAFNAPEASEIKNISPEMPREKMYDVTAYGNLSI